MATFHGGIPRKGWPYYQELMNQLGEVHRKMIPRMVEAFEAAPRRSVDRLIYDIRGSNWRKMFNR